MTREDWLDDFSAVGAFLEELLETETFIHSTDDTFFMDLGVLDSGDELSISLEYDPTISGEDLMRTLGKLCREATAEEFEEEFSE